jgi:hypothetical protein
MKPVGATLGWGGDIVLEYETDKGERGFVLFGGRTTDMLFHSDYYPQGLATPWPVDPETGKQMPLWSDT